MRIRCLVIGVGKMGLAHLQVLTALGIDAVAGWAPSSRRRQLVETIGVELLDGPLDDALRTFRPSHVVVASPVETLTPTALVAMAAGVRHLLVEKPTALSVVEGERLAAAAAACGARVHVGYNRRFYASVRTALSRIRERRDRVSSVFFEFNETIADPAGPSRHAPPVRARWVLANSLHVVDMAFLPAGRPDPGKSRFLAAGTLPWHPSSSIFAGAGETDRGVLFGYHANWNGPGRWAVEWVTSSERYVFRPLETLSVLRAGTTTLTNVDFDNDLDRRFKPGVYLEDKAFLENDGDSGAATMDDALSLLSLGQAMASYPSGAVSSSSQ